MAGIVEKMCRRYLKKRGWALASTASVDREGNYFLYQYNDKNGKFDYDRYRNIQIKGNRKKLENIWADQPTIEFISNYLRSTQRHLKRGLCHGSRNGTEVKWFRDSLGIDVIGSDISDTAIQFPHLTQWDFHETNDEWVGAFDFVYTNSHDHAYDPAKAFDAWVQQLSPGGALIIEHTMGHSQSGTGELDPFGVHPTILPFLVAKWGAGRYAVTEILEPPHTKPGGLKIWVFVIRSLRSIA